MKQSSRAERKTKRRKTNRILNTAIAVVVLLIIVVGFTIFAGGNDEEPAAPEALEQSETAAVATEEPAEAPEEPVEEPPAAAEKTDEAAGEPELADEEAENKEAETGTEEADNETTSTDEAKAAVITEGTEPNVEQEIVNPEWDAVETSQSGEHTSSFETNSVDWKEKEQALSYATGIDPGSMTVWYISGNGANAAIGTVSPESNPDEAYRVHIQWADGEGWKPTKVQKLIENDKGR